VKRKELEKILKNKGWVLMRHGRRHDIWSDGTLDVAVPRHREIHEYTAGAILKLVEGKSQ
jgi:mRNA interferase HicA